MKSGDLSDMQGRTAFSMGIHIMIILWIVECREEGWVIEKLSAAIPSSEGCIYVTFRF